MFLDKLKNYQLILASGSPRRKELLEGIGVPVKVELNGEVNETYPSEMPLEEVPEHLAQVKSLGFGRKLANNELLITADTVVICNQQLLGKPVDKADAERMLKMLSGNEHQVLTGVCLRTAQHTRTFTAHTAVYFRPLSIQEIDYYIDAYKPYDKAGAYGVQEWIGYVGIERIDGSYFNVMGLPMQRLCTELDEFLN